jgi:aldehyde:ferredoxin oxidoreductase
MLSQSFRPLQAVEEKIMAGWSEKILDIDLSNKTYKIYPLDMEMARLFIGGRGIGTRLLWDLVGPEVDALSPENVLIFTAGPLTATGYQTSNRFSVSTKSPLTGTVLDKLRRLLGDAIQEGRL